MTPATSVLGSSSPTAGLRLRRLRAIERDHYGEEPRREACKRMHRRTNARSHSIAKPRRKPGPTLPASRTLASSTGASEQCSFQLNSLQVTLTQRTSHGLSFTAGYTFAHGLDNGSLNRFGLLPQNSNNPGAEYGSSDFDIRQRFTLTTTYNIPGVKGYGQLLEGWQINSIYTYQTAQPVEPLGRRQ